MPAALSISPRPGGGSPRSMRLVQAPAPVASSTPGYSAGVNSPRDFANAASIKYNQAFVQMASATTDNPMSPRSSASRRRRRRRPPAAARRRPLLLLLPRLPSG